MRAVLALLALTLPMAALAQETPPAPRPSESRPAPKPDVAEPDPPPQLGFSDPAQPAADGGTPRLRYTPAAPVADAPPPAALPAPAPQRPPVHETLREDDFAYSACLLDLSLMGADYSEEAAVTDPEHRDCGIDRPIMLREPLPGIAINGGAMMRCETAWHLAHWLRDSVRPAAALLPGQPQLAGIEPGSTYQCRPTVGDKGENLSEHAFGNAFDVSALTFRDGSRIEIQPRQDSGDMAEAFQAAIRGAACLHFTTVLGPGSNAAHDDHLHLDIKARDSGWRLCQ